MVQTRCYRNGVVDDESFSLGRVSEHLEDESALVWIDLCAPDLAELMALGISLADLSGAVGRRGHHILFLAA